MNEETPPVEIEPLLAALAHVFLKNGRGSDASLLASANPQFEVTGYDNWNGGTTVWELRLQIPYPDYLALGDEQRADIEKFIDDAIAPFLPETGHWVHAKVKPGPFEDPDWRQRVTTLVRDPSALEKLKSAESDAQNYAFISYQTADKHIAGRIQRLFEDVGIKSFLAHENIEASTVWRDKILEELGRANIFVSLLSSNYFNSDWCVQESGIAAYRKMTSLHLSIDGSTPKGFSSNIQSAKIDPDSLSLLDLLPGIVSSNFDLGIHLYLNVIGRSKSFRNAEANFRLILPYINRMRDSQVQSLLEKCAANSQVHHATQCAGEYIPPVLASHGHLLDQSTREFLESVCEQYK